MRLAAVLFAVAATAAAKTLIYPVEAIPDLWKLDATAFREKYAGINVTGLGIGDEGWYVRYRHENLAYFFGPIAEREEARNRMWELERIREEVMRQRPALASSQVDMVRFDYSGAYGQRGDTPYSGEGLSDERNGPAGDLDGDGIPNAQDDDLDGDGISNAQDGDADGDGIPNGADDFQFGTRPGDPRLDPAGDLDGDGIPNSEDGDMDGDGVPNGQDGDPTNAGRGGGGRGGGNSDAPSDGVNGPSGDLDGDGISNTQDGDMDGDGIPNGMDEDADGDGLPNAQDTYPYGLSGEERDQQQEGAQIADPSGRQSGQQPGRPGQQQGQQQGRQQGQSAGQQGQGQQQGQQGGQPGQPGQSGQPGQGQPGSNPLEVIFILLRKALGLG